MWLRTVGQGNEYCWHQKPLWCKLIDCFFYQKNEATISRSVKISVHSCEQKCIFFLIHPNPCVEKVQRTSYAWLENEDGNSRTIIRKECTQWNDDGLILNKFSLCCSALGSLPFDRLIKFHSGIMKSSPKKSYSSILSEILICMFDNGVMTVANDNYICNDSPFILLQHVLKSYHQTMPNT